ncbi:hypothetical protein CB1_000850032 [Camelus ferus]|nr:hypothetical protein CB1_000850032 [Camelus ferus]
MLPSLLPSETRCQSSCVNRTLVRGCRDHRTRGSAPLRALRCWKRYTSEEKTECAKNEPHAYFIADILEIILNLGCVIRGNLHLLYSISPLPFIQSLPMSYVFFLHSASPLVNEETVQIWNKEQAEALALQRVLRKEQMCVHSLEKVVEQKTKENNELTRICDDLLSKMEKS